jgi:hypothetical protein
MTAKDATLEAILIFDCLDMEILPPLAVNDFDLADGCPPVSGIVSLCQILCQ